MGEKIVTGKVNSGITCQIIKDLLSYNSLMKFRGVAQPGSAPALGAGGRWFKSSHPDEV